MVTTANYFAPRLIGKFTQDYPGINISLEVGNREQLLDRMSRNMDDVYLIGKPPESSELYFQPYLENPMVVVSTVSDPLSGRKSIPLAKIAEQPFIIREQGSGTRIAVEKLFAEHDLSLDVRMELGSNESIKQGISGGLGIAVISQHTLTSGDMNELTILDVENFPLSWQWYVGYPHGKRLSVVARTFIDYMYKEGPSLLTDRIENTSPI